MAEGWIGDIRPLAPRRSIRVVVRVRPVMDFERTRGDVPVVFPREDAPGVKVRGAPAAVSGAALTRPHPPQLEASGTGGQSIDKNYVFNACFGQDATQQSFFEACGVRELLNSVMEGCGGFRAARRRLHVTPRSPPSAATLRRCSRTGRRDRARRTA